MNDRMSISSADISVIIPTYNRKDSLLESVRSVDGQTAPVGEVIVVDDGSTDGTSNLIRDAFPHVRLLTQENHGVSSARNRGLRHAQGSWSAFLDSDDTWLPEKIQRQIYALSRQPDIRICHTEEIWIRNGRRVNQMKKHAKRGGWLFERSLELCCISPSSVLLSQAIFSTYGVFDETLPACEDYDLWLRLTAHESTVYVDDPMIIKTGGHDDQLSRKYWGMDRFRIRAIEKLLDAGQLSADQTSAALAMLIRKLEILVGGAEKRGNREVVEEYGPRLIHWASRQTKG